MRSTGWMLGLLLLLISLPGCSDSDSGSSDTPLADGDSAQDDDDEDGDIAVDGDEDGDLAPDGDEDGEEEEWVFNRDDYETINGWILLDSNPDAVVESIETAAEYGVNHIQLSHNLIMNIDEIVGDDESVQTRVSTLNLGIDKAHEYGMKAFIWVHELSEMGMDVCFDRNDPIWEARRQVYRDALAKLPDLDGVVFMFGSAPMPPWYTLCSCDYCMEEYGDSLSMPQEDKLTIITEEIGGMLVGELGLELLIRTFVHEPNELEFHGQGLSAVKGVEFTGMHKSDVQDWQPYNPFHANVGHVGNHPSIMEFDLAGEYVGQSELPYCAPGFYWFRLQYLWKNKGIGAVSRIQRGSNHALGTPNEINILAMRRLMEDIETPLEDIWKEFVESFYQVHPGSEDEQSLIAILKDTFPIRRKSHYALGIWALEKSSDIPSEISLNQFRDRGEMPKWDADYEEVYASLNVPTKETLLWLWQEGQESVDLAEESLTRFESLTDGALSQEQHDDLLRRLNHQYYAAKVWRDIDLVIWGHRMASDLRDDTIRGWINYAIEDLAQVQQAMSDAGLSDVQYANPSRVGSFHQNVLGDYSEGITAQEPQGLRFKPLRIEMTSASEAQVTIRANQAVTVMLDSGTEMPDYGTETEATLSGDEPQAVVTLKNLEPKTRYVVRVRAEQDGLEYRGGDFWFYVQ